MKSTFGFRIVEILNKLISKLVIFKFKNNNKNNNFVELLNERTKKCLYWKHQYQEILVFCCPVKEFKAKQNSTELKEGKNCLWETELGSAIRANTCEEEKELRFIVK